MGPEATFQALRYLLLESYLFGLNLAGTAVAPAWVAGIPLDMFDILRGRRPRNSVKNKTLDVLHPMPLA